MGVPLKGAVGSEGCQYFSSIQMVCDVLQKCIARRLGTCSETGVLPGLGAGTLMKRGASGGRVLVRKDPRRCWLRVDVRAHLIQSFDLATMATQELTDPGHTHGSAPQEQ